MKRMLLSMILLFPGAIFSRQESLQEGFCKDTLVKVFYGYKKIQDVVVGDLLYSPSGEYQTVLSVEKKEMQSYMKFCVEDELLCVALHQKFQTNFAACDEFDCCEYLWIDACDIARASCFLKDAHKLFSFEFIEQVDEPIEVYILEVQGNIYYVTSYDIAVHNSDSIKRGIQVLQVGCMLVEHPVAKLIGAVLELASVGVDVYEMFKDTSVPEDVAQEIQHHDIFIPERFYFEVMRKKLTDLKKEFVDIQNIVCEYYDLKNDFLETAFDPFIVTIAQEATCNELQKKQLRYVRENELHQLEQDIVDLQYQIAWSFSKLIDERSESLRNVRKVLGYVSDLRSSIKNSLHTAAQDQLLNLFAREMYLEKTLNIYFKCNAKLVLIMNFLKQPLNADVLKQTSNIMEVIARVESEIATCDFIF